MTKRKRDWPGARPVNRRPPPTGPDGMEDRPNLARINADARVGKDGFSVGDKVVIAGSGLYSGETAVIERLSGSVIPSAVVRTASGNARQVRTIDLVHASNETTLKD